MNLKHEKGTWTFDYDKSRVDSDSLNVLRRGHRMLGAEIEKLERQYKAAAEFNAKQVNLLDVIREEEAKKGEND